MADVYPGAGTTVAIIAGRTHEMDAGARRVLTAVRAVAARHKLTGAYMSKLSIVEARGLSGNGRRVTDRLVVADDEGSISIEYGHIQRVKGARRVKFIPGQHIMRRGMEAA